MEGVKSDILHFQLQFLTSNSYSNDVEVIGLTLNKLYLTIVMC